MKKILVGALPRRSHVRYGSLTPWGIVLTIMGKIRTLGNIHALRAKAEERLAAIPSPTRLADKIVLVDVGASGGLQQKWWKHKHNIIPVVFEPNPDQAEAMKRWLAGFGEYRIINYGLSDRAGSYTLNIGASYSTTSFLPANMAMLGEYDIAKYFQTDRTTDVPCVRYDELVEREAAYVPDVIKIDVEGFETRVMDGFGDLLHDVLGIETEAWFYPGFKGQGMFHEIIEKLDRFGLRLRHIETVPGFEGDLVCINAYFTMNRRKYRALSGSRRKKFDVMSKVWALPVYQ